MLRKSSKFIYSITSIFNAYSVAALIIFFNLLEMPKLSTDLSIIYSITFISFFSFSLNERIFLFSKKTSFTLADFLSRRINLGIFLFIFALIIGIKYHDSIGVTLLTALIIRRYLEWIYELFIVNLEISQNFKACFIFLCYELIALAFVVIAYLLKINYAEVSFWIFAFLPLIPSLKFIFRNYTPLRNQKFFDKKLQGFLTPFIFIGILQAISLYIFRVELISYSKDLIYASNIITAFTIGGVFATLSAGSVTQSVIFHENNQKRKSTLFYKIIFYLIIIGLIGSLVFQLFDINLFKPKYFFIAFFSSLAASGINSYALLLRQRKLFLLNNCYKQDILIGFATVLCIPTLFYYADSDLLPLAYFFNSIIFLFVYL